MRPPYVLLEPATLKKPKNGVQHVLRLTKKWIDMTKAINDDVLHWKLFDGKISCKRIVLS